jgi:NAD(P)-dependent dehydrogenase (short-subunit alcohol dehydrogenase family)
MSSTKAAFGRLDLSGKRCIVTGASSGIGKATAVLMTARGATVCLIARRLPLLQQIVKEELGGKGYAVQADFTDNAQCLRSIEEAAKLLGGIDVLVNNAGGFEASRANDLNAILQLNLNSAITCTQAAYPWLKKSKGNIVNITSIAGVMASPDITYYAVAKAGLNHVRLRCT